MQYKKNDDKNLVHSKAVTKGRGFPLDTASLSHGYFDTKPKH